jgi:hypothetical protein
MKDVREKRKTHFVETFTLSTSAYYFVLLLQGTNWKRLFCNNSLNALKHCSTRERSHQGGNTPLTSPPDIPVAFIQY